VNAQPTTKNAKYLAIAGPSLNVTKLHQHSKHGCDGRHETSLLSRSDVLLIPKKGHFRRLLIAHTTGTCGRATYKLTWKEIVALYRLTERQPAVNMPSDCYETKPGQSKKPRAG
jgi:hypothetical protein